MNRNVVAVILQVVGILLVATAGWLVEPELGIALLGLGYVVMGIALERDT
jgi:hypothetical protein